MAVKTDQKTYLSWDDVEKSVNNLCDKIRFDQPNIDSVHGIARGGLIPAVLISHKLGLPYVQAVGKNTLVVDDICDTGVTLEKGPGVYTAVLHYKPHTSCFQPTMWSEIHEGNEWLIYPWETKDSLPIQDYLANDAKKQRDELEEYYKSDEFLEFAALQDAVNTELDKREGTHYVAGMTNDKDGSFMKFQNKLKNNE
jgi:hypoxanthine phosphoribosyltransferase|tara:strand:- start:66 stop:656 length:591 start_codon:yes stop_codon:yes gene_type:complete